MLDRALNPPSRPPTASWWTDRQARDDERTWYEIARAEHERMRDSKDAARIRPRCLDDI